MRSLSTANQKGAVRDAYICATSKTWLRSDAWHRIGPLGAIQLLKHGDDHGVNYGHAVTYDHRVDYDHRVAYGDSPDNRPDKLPDRATCSWLSKSAEWGIEFCQHL